MRLWAVLAANWARARAKQKGILVDISNDDVDRAIQESAGLCAYCRRPLNFQASMEGRHESPSLDRILPALGYTAANIVVACYRCNAIKSDTTPAELEGLASAVTKLIARRGLVQTKAQ